VFLCGSRSNRLSTCSCSFTVRFEFQFSFLIMSNCQVCLLAFKKNQLKITCNDCKKQFHGKCVNLSAADIAYITEEQQSVWRCDPCGKSRRQSLRLEATADEGKLTLEDIVKTLREIRDEQKKTVRDFNESYGSLHDKLEENAVTLNQGMSSIENFVKVIEELKSENSFLKSKVSNLEKRIDDLEQYSRRNCIELQGIPEKKDESVLDLVKNVGKALNFEITEDMVDACHRIGKPENATRPRGIIVKFVRRTDKEKLINKRREKKRDFSIRHIGLPEDKPIFINESLSPARRRLFAMAREQKKKQGVKYLWLRGGSILMRATDGSPVIEIQSVEDLEKLSSVSVQGK
jgi:polyhydroxyalkanoate synthesis regulator phasin